MKNLYNFFLFWQGLYPQRYAGEQIFGYYNGHNYYDTLLLNGSLTYQAIISSLQEVKKEIRLLKTG